MSKSMERLARSFMVIRSQLEKAQREGREKDDEVVLATARRIGIAIQIAGRGIQEAAEEGKFLDIMYYVTHVESLTTALMTMFDRTILEEFRQLKDIEPKDFE